jgi:CRP-like cAMP-binding protein
MIPALKQSLSAYIPMEEDYLEEFLSRFKSVKYDRNDYFIRQGQVSRFVGFIVKGCLMCTYNSDGKEFIDEFSMENEFITDYGSFIRGTPADKDVICLEDSELLILGYQSLQELYDMSPVFERAGRLIAEMLFINWQQRVKSLLLDDAETRYRKLIENRPELTQRVPQYLVAQYLGISQETLSRIRKRKPLQ